MSVDAGPSLLEPTAPVTPGAEFRHLLLVEAANFAAVRRAIGVPRADLLMLDVAERLADLLPDACIATAGRNLVELSFACGLAGALDTAIATIHRGFGQPMMLDGEPHMVTLIVGGACVPAIAADDVRLIEQAERALADARLAQAPAAAAPVAADDAQIGRELQAAVARDELFVQYQPKLHVRQQKIAGVEALVRWHHPRRGLVLPNDFIPQAERTGDIAAMTLWTLRRVIADQKTLIRNGYDLPVYVNMAGVLLSDDAFVTQVIDLVRDGGARLGMEITETSVIKDPQGAIRHLQRLADIGVAITIDDYGAGLSSLAYLKQLPATELKIDKLFVTKLTSSHRDPLIVRSTIDLAHALEMEVVAEGVETAASLALLTVMGCDLVQGFLISRPLALEALLAFLRDDSHLALAIAPPSPFERLAAVRARN
ncbi:EAL domain-containing protein [Sphingomonas sp.]|uniref:EAL domain-containing protein n=1 Tax=Sphingomonas sp. TaxID=28214 RepID=UPI003B009DB4